MGASSEPKATFKLVAAETLELTTYSALRLVLGVTTGPGWKYTSIFDPPDKMNW